MINLAARAYQSAKNTVKLDAKPPDTGIRKKRLALWEGKTCSSVELCWLGIISRRPEMDQVTKSVTPWTTLNEKNSNCPTRQKNAKCTSFWCIAVTLLSGGAVGGGTIWPWHVANQKPSSIKCLMWPVVRLTVKLACQTAREEDVIDAVRYHWQRS